MMMEQTEFDLLRSRVNQMPPAFQLSRSEPTQALYRRLQLQQPSFASGVAAIVELGPMLGRAQRRQMRSSGFRLDLAALRADRNRALSQLLNG